MAEPYSPHRKPVGVGHRLERARRQPGLGARGVVARGSDVVRGVGVEDRGQVLDLAAAGAELPLAAAVGADPVLVAVVVGREELVQRAEPRRLDVDHLRRPWLRLDVGDRVDRRVPGDAVGDRVEDRPGLVVHVRVLEPGVREGFDQLAVELGIGVDVDRGALVLPLQVERVDSARLDELPDQLVAPVVGGIELEAKGGVDLEPLANRLDGRDLLRAGGRQPHRDHEGDGPRLPPEHLV